MEEGAKVYVLDIINMPNDFDVIDVEYIHCDVSDYIMVEDAIQTIVENDGAIDILFSNAGIFSEATLEETSISDIHHIVGGVNLLGTMYALKSVLPVMKEQNSGCIILNSSDQYFVGKKKNALYMVRPKGGLLDNLPRVLHLIMLNIIFV